METATLVIAVIGLALATASLAWQAATFFLTGPRVKVYLREGFRGPGGVMIAPPSVYTDSGRVTLEQQGYTEHVVAIEAINRGRLPTTVRNWALRFGNRASYTNPTDPRNPTLPYRLEPFTSVTWYAPVEHLQMLQQAFADQSDNVATVRGEVDLASRKTLTSRDGVVVAFDRTRLVTPLLARVVSRLRRRKPS